MKNIVLIALVTIGIGILVYANNKIDNPPKPCIPTFLDGGGPYYKTNAPERDHLAPPGALGMRLEVKGKVLEKDCKTPLSGAMVDIWQADETGKYQDQWYRGQVKTDNKGNYAFSTVIPKGYGEGTGYRPPHIHFKIWQNDMERITSQMFFPDVIGREGFNNEYIMQISKNGDTSKAYHDIILP